MTGFGRAEGDVNDTRWVWELRAVNGKGLDLRLRLPHGHEKLEADLRKIAKRELSRGNIQAILTLQQASESAKVRVNEEFLQVVMNAITRIDQAGVTQPSTAAEILSVRGVLETGSAEVDEDEHNTLQTAIKAGFEQALAALNAHRREEGKSLEALLQGQLETIAELTERAEKDPHRSAEAIKGRLERQIANAKSVDGAVDPDRIAQEIAILLTKSDIREELDRLVAHVNGARDLIKAGSPVGRKLEFLAQEFNRESNTLCSKSNAVSITETGLELKTVIDQFREQCLNVE